MLAICLRTFNRYSRFLPATGVTGKSVLREDFTRSHVRWGIRKARFTPEPEKASYEVHAKLRACACAVGVFHHNGTPFFIPVFLTRRELCPRSRPQRLHVRGAGEK